MLFEGLTIQKIPYKERDLIVKLVLRNGTMASFYIYGGQGGGKHHKPAAFELGCMMKILVKEKSQKVEGSELMIAAEHQKLWEPIHLRHDVRAFYLACLYFEITQKVSIGENEGLFSVLSNALFYLDDSLAKKNFLPEQHLGLFMVKLIFHLGIMPDIESCSTCGTDLNTVTGATFMFASGQFACLQCMAAENEMGLRLRISQGIQTKFQNYTEFSGARFSECDKLIQYFCHQFHLKPVDLKSYALLFR